MESIWVISGPGGCGPRLDLRGRGWQPRAMGDEAISVRPANEAGWDDLRAVFGSRGQGAVCFCQRYKLAPGRGVQAPSRGGAGGAAAGPGGVRAGRGRRAGWSRIAGAEPVGWCAVEPRVAYPGLLRVYRVPWAGRREDKADAGVWAVTCFFVRAGFRRQGVSAALARAAVDFARSGGRGRSRAIRC